MRSFGQVAGAWSAALVALLLAVVSSGCAHVPTAISPALATASNICNRTQPLRASEQDRLLRFASLVRDGLNDSDHDVVLISRAGVDMSLFDIRYTHAAIGWRDEAGVWTIRQLYYDCEEGQPRIFDQGVAGFVMGIENASVGYISIVTLPPHAAASLRSAALDAPRALQLLATSYSANAYAFGLDYQNCNQWVAELMATAWGDLPGRDNLRAEAQQWLRQAGYAPPAVIIRPGWLMLAARGIPFVHVDDHPPRDRKARRLHVSLPAALEDFVRKRYATSKRIEICHDGREAVVREGWPDTMRINETCRSAAGDRTVALDDL